MTLHYMEIFIAVYKNGTITKAAQELHMTQPVVTRAIQELEKYYGIRLFERINKRLSITEAGQRFYAYALHIIDSFNQMEKSLRNWDKLGVIRVGASATLGSILLPKVLKKYTSIYPDITVKATVTYGTKLQAMLENNELDFALIEGGFENKNLLTEELGEDRLILLLPLDSPLLKTKKLFMEDLVKYPFLVQENESVSRILLNHTFAMHGLTLTPLLESVNTHTIVQCVHTGLGISFLPERLVRHSIESGFVATRSIQGESFLRKNYIVYHKNKFLSQSAKDFLALCHAEAEK